MSNIIDFEKIKNEGRNYQQAMAFVLSGRDLDMTKIWRNRVTDYAGRTCPWDERMEEVIWDDEDWIQVRFIPHAAIHTGLRESYDYKTETHELDFMYGVTHYLDMDFYPLACNKNKRGK